MSIWDDIGSFLSSTVGNVEHAISGNSGPQPSQQAAQAQVQPQTQPQQWHAPMAAQPDQGAIQASQQQNQQQAQPQQSQNQTPGLASYLGHDYARTAADVGSGIARGIIGMGQAASGLVDLASPGKGTSQVSKDLNFAAKKTDQLSQQNHVNPIVYKGMQVATNLVPMGDVMGGANILDKADEVASNLPGVAKVASKLDNLGNSGSVGKVVANTIRSAASPKNAIVNAGYQALNAGQEASKGQKVTPLGQTENFAATQVGVPLAGHSLIEGVSKAAPALIRTAQGVQSKFGNVALQGAEKATGLSRNQIVNDNEAGMLRDHAARIMRDKTNIPTQQINNTYAVAKNIGLDIKSGSPRDIANRIENYISQRNQFMKVHNAIGQGGYAKLPFLEDGEKEISPVAQEYGNEKSSADMVKDAAETMRQHDKTVKGGQLQPDGEGGYVRTSEHTPFYSDYYALNKKAPTKVAYELEAKKQLEGNGGDLIAPEEAQAYKVAKQREVENSALGQQVKVKKVNGNKVAVFVPKNRLENDPELKSLYNTAEKSQFLSPMDKLKSEEAVTTHMRQRNADAERVALDHLKNGGSRDEAVQLYKQTAGVSEKAAKFRVQQAAKQADQALHPNESGENPLKGTIELPEVNKEDYTQVKMNYSKGVQRISHASDKFQAFKTKLSDEDRTNFWDYVEGTKTPSNDNTVQSALKAWKTLSDTVHEVDRAAGGKTAYIKNFALHSWDYENPNTIMALEQKAVAHEGITPEQLAELSPEDRSALLQKHSYINPAAEDANYGGYHAKNRIFATRQEGLDAGMVPKNKDAFEDAQKYANGAKINIGDEILKGGLRGAEPDLKSPIHTLNTFGGSKIDTTEKGYEAMHEFDIKNREKSVGVFRKSFDAVMNPIIQSIVLNPLIHGQNLGFQQLVESGNSKLFPKAEGALGKIPAGPIGMARSIGKFTNLLVNKDARESALQTYLENGGHIPTYGKNTDTVISKALDTIHAPHINKANSSAMSSLDGLFRITAHENDLANGVDARKSVENIDKFLGDKSHVSDTSHYLGMFAHYFKTQAKTLFSLGAHPKENAGAIANFTTLAATWYGLNKAYQKWTGNKHAALRAPGALGLVQEGAEAPGQLRNGQVPSIVTNHVNPLVQVAANQAFGKDLYSNQTLNSTKARVSDAVQNLFGPSQQASSIAEGKKSIPEVLIDQLTGSKTPHVKGAPAIPNTNNPLTFINTKGAKNQAGGDVTGIDQANSYFQGKAKMLQGADPKDTDTINKYFDRAVSPTGQKILGGTVGGYNNAKDLVDNYNQKGQALQKVYQFEHGQKNNDPLWSLPLTAPAGKPSVLSYLQVENQYEGPEKDGAKEKAQGSLSSGWLTNLENQRNTYYNKLDPSASAAANEPAYPVFDKPTTADMNAADKISNSSQYSTFLDTHPDVTDALARTEQWTNQIRQLEGGPPLPQTQQASPVLQKIINTYDALPPSKSSGNTNPATSGMRAAWIKANPTAYSAMSSYFAQSSMSSLLKNAITAVYSGQNGTNQSVLKNAKSVGADVAQGSNGVYSINPAAAYAQTSGYSSGSSSSSDGSKTYKVDLSPLYAPKVNAHHPKGVSKVYVKLSDNPLKYSKAKTYSSVPIGQAGPKNAPKGAVNIGISTV